MYISFLKSRIVSALLYLLLSISSGYAQSAQSTDAPDSTSQFPEVMIHGYLSKQPLLETLASVAIIGTSNLRKNSQQTLLPALNFIPGIRMEERSPASYRLSIRGSLLRSPFGIRNVKVYMDEFPLTDAGGNTYLNLIDPSSIERIEILKGPDSSLFGANSGGVVLFDLAGQQHDSTLIAATISGGSYGLFHENITLKKKFNHSVFSVNQAVQRADGYRTNSSMLRNFVQGSWKLNYGKRNSVKLLGLYSDLQYQTPGALTQAQYEDDPQQARPASGNSRGAAEQHAGIYNKTFFTGASNELHFSQNVRYVFSVFGTYTDYKNPFITNYENRFEKNIGIRSYFEVLSVKPHLIEWTWNIGLEGQNGNQKILTYENNGGVSGQLQASDIFTINQIFYFTRFGVTVGKRFTAEGAVSLNNYKYAFTGLLQSGTHKIKGEWMPRLAVRYSLHSGIALRASVSKGYSPPTLSEVRPSGNEINKNLNAESGWNREVGLRFTTSDSRVQFDASVFRYDLRNAIVRRVDEADSEFFINAGGTKQTGVEMLLHTWLIAKKEKGIITGLEFNASYTHSHFRFSNYSDGLTNYSNNLLTGVPNNTLLLSGTLHVHQKITLFVQHNLTSRIPLNDANSAFADRYTLLQAKLSWLTSFTKCKLELFAGADNILNQTYSLGNDINAFGGRYFNAALPLNLYGGLNFIL